MGRVDFDAALFVGRIGEQMVVRFLRLRGLGVIPCYDYTGKAGDKAPWLQFTGDRRFILPDVDVCGGGDRFWFEIKSYYGPADNRALGAQVHGIPGRLYRDYLEVEKESGCPVYIAVLEISTGLLLAAQLLGLKTYSCMCSPCRSNRDDACVAPLKNGRVWKRDDMRTAHRFSDAEMSEIRAAHASSLRKP